MEGISTGINLQTACLIGRKEVKLDHWCVNRNSNKGLLVIVVYIDTKQVSKQIIFINCDYLVKTILTCHSIDFSSTWGKTCLLTKSYLLE